MALWRQVIETFEHEGERRLAERLPLCGELEAVDTALAILPDFLRSFAAQPQLTRLMLQEFSVTSERSAWLREHFAEPVWILLKPLFERLRDEGRLGGAAPDIAYFSMIGWALITFGNADLIHQVAQGDPTSPQWRDQAIDYMIGPVVASGSRRS
ncbi:hypothetical protein ACFOON_02155 [Novosphingobium piscinae]|uniref:TetR family transcriptional regulator n=1 Tax=Novosphingobium piscinae TaxID=1507448 RepID=A0A7X1FWD6_9SPHN|nr:hypothetical protein [Novosphingobium piscinae]MBC2667612.1 hypothetical protein [Novosphingobium piscinae]